MKKIIFLLLGLFIISQWSCKKDHPITFSSVSFTDIKAHEASFTADPIVVSTADAELLKAGSIIVFHTEGGNYGKLVITNTGYNAPNALVFDMVVYNAQGVEILSKQGLSISTGYLADLDLGEQTAVDGQQSFYWVDHTISPEQTGTFYVLLAKN